MLNFHAGRIFHVLAAHDTHFRAFVPADLLVGYACMARPFQAAYDSGRCAAPCCITAVIDPAHPQMQAAVAKNSP